MIWKWNTLISKHFDNLTGNYYPITSMITIKDSASTKELHVVNDRAQGGSSLRDGEVEIMVQY